MALWPLNTKMRVKSGESWRDIASPRPSPLNPQPEPPAIPLA